MNEQDYLGIESTIFCFECSENFLHLSPSKWLILSNAKFILSVAPVGVFYGYDPGWVIHTVKNII